MIRSPTTSQLRVSTPVSQRTKVSSCLATSTPMHAWSPSSVRASPAASPRPSWRCVRDPDSHIPEASPTLATRIALPDASAADRGSSGGDLGPARFRVSSQIAPRMILRAQTSRSDPVDATPWPPPPSRPRSRSTFCYPRQSEKNSARLTVVPPPPAPQVFKKCRDHKLCDSKALIGAYTAVPKSTMYFLSNPPTPCPPNRAEPRHLPPVAELTQRRESSVIATRSDPNTLFP